MLPCLLLPRSPQHGVPLLAPGSAPALDESKLVTHSFCGTEHYMAPEMLLQQGHGKAVDWWCLGILACEMLQGRHPFDGGNHYQTLRNMVTKEPVLHHSLSPAARSAVKGLLRREQHRRLGAGPGGLDKLQSHPFFLGLEWEALYRREVTPPFCPDIQGEGDVGHFEKTFTREAAIDSTIGGEKGGAGGEDGGFFNGLFPFFGGGNKGGSSSGRQAAVPVDDEFASFSYAAPEVLSQATATQTAQEIVGVSM